MQPKITVIVPIYGVEKYIERCVRSLMEQTFREVEYIFVDDASPDQSIPILCQTLSDYPERAQQVRVISHQENLGLPAARNTGLQAAIGEYVYHCDSDDYVDKNILQSLYLVAQKRQADYVWCDFYATKEDLKQYCNQRSYSLPIEALRGSLQGELAYNVWNKLVKRELYTAHNITFPSGYSMGEDMTMLMLLARAQKVAYVPRPLYYYVRSNAGALTKQELKPIHIEALHHNLSRVVSDIVQLYGENMKDALTALQLQVKWQFLVCGEHEKYHIWRTWFPELHQYIWRYRHTQSNFRIKLIEWFAAKGQYWVVWLHYQIVIRFYTNWLRKP